jgi:hypothetical protein
MRADGGVRRRPCVAGRRCAISCAGACRCCGFVLRYTGVVPGASRCAHGCGAAGCVARDLRAGGVPSFGSSDVGLVLVSFAYTLCSWSARSVCHLSVSCGVRVSRSAFCCAAGPGFVRDQSGVGPCQSVIRCVPLSNKQARKSLYPSVDPFLCLFPARSTSMSTSSMSSPPTAMSDHASSSSSSSSVHHGDARLSASKSSHDGAGHDAGAGGSQTVGGATSIFHRSWFWVALGVGAVCVSAGVGFLIYRSRKSSAKASDAKDAVAAHS